jgi:hypothetical protein
VNLDRARDDWTLGLFPLEDLPELAAQMMIQGYEGQSILELASFRRSDGPSIPAGLVEEAFTEAGRPSLSAEDVERLRSERVLSEAEELILACLDERLDVRDLGRRLWKLSGRLEDPWGSPLGPLLGPQIEGEDAFDAKSQRRAELELLRAAGAFLKAREERRGSRGS